MERKLYPVPDEPESSCIHQTELALDIMFYRRCLEAAMKAPTYLSPAGEGTPEGTAVIAEILLIQTNGIKDACPGLNAAGECPYAESIEDFRAIEGLRSDIVQRAGGYPPSWKKPTQ